MALDPCYLVATKASFDLLALSKGQTPPEVMATSWPAARACQHLGGLVNDILIVELSYDVYVLLGGTFNDMKECPEFCLL
jgi:hypothetical protein